MPHTTTLRLFTIQYTPRFIYAGTQYSDTFSCHTECHRCNSLPYSMEDVLTIHNVRPHPYYPLTRLLYHIDRSLNDRIGGRGGGIHSILHCREGRSGG